MNHIEMFWQKGADIKQANNANNVEGLEYQKAKHKTSEFMFPMTFKRYHGNQ